MSIKAPVSEAAIRAYYTAKTTSILAKYGPGPKVHFHTGIMPPEDAPLPKTLAALKDAMAAAQEAMVVMVLGLWDSPARFEGARILDCGFGLGGAAIYWAAQCHAQVTGVSIATDHVGIARRLADEAGVGDRARFREGDVCGPDFLTGADPFDIAVALEAACHFDRPRWLRNMARLVRVGGRLCVADVFLGPGGDAAAMRRYWHIDLATRDELTHAARDEGFRVVCTHDLTEASAGFWSLSIRYSQLALEACESTEEQERLQASIIEHRRMQREWRTGSIQYLVLCFAREAGRKRPAAR